MLKIAILVVLWGCSESNTASSQKKSKATTTAKSLEQYEVVLIPKGTFSMGCTEEEEAYCLANEAPLHEVIISQDFYLMKTEVTQNLYRSVLEKNPSRFQHCKEDCPVENVSWLDAVKFANALSQKEGLELCYQISEKIVVSVRENVVTCTGWRLPTEAEWEYAARGGETHKHSGSDNISEVGWSGEDSSSGSTHSVGKKKANGFGVYDMSGNVCEWCWDWYDKEYYNTSPSVDPTGAASGTERVYRGGGWDREVRSARVSDRYWDHPSELLDDLGFRLVKTNAASDTQSP